MTNYVEEVNYYLEGGKKNNSNSNSNSNNSNSNSNNSNSNKNINFDIFGDIKTDVNIVYEYEKLDTSYNLKTDDTILENELENIFLRKLPFSKQNNIAFQNLILEKVKTFINLKNETFILLNKCFKNDYLKDKTFKGIFNNNIIPIINNKKKIFNKIFDSDDNDLINKKGVYFTSESQEYEKLNNIIFDYKMNNMSYIDFELKINRLLDPYENIDNYGYNTCPDYLFTALRNVNLDNIDYSMNNVLNNYCIYLENNSKDAALKQKCIIPANKASIVGFVVINNLYGNLNSLYDESIFNYINYNKIGKITSFTKSKQGEFTLDSDNIITGQSIYINNSNLPINGIHKNIKLISKNTFILNINTKNLNVKDNFGDVYSNIPLNLNIVKGNFNKLKDNKSNKINTYLFNEKLLNKKEYLEIIEKVIPKLEDLVLSKIDDTNTNTISKLIEINNFLISNKIDFIQESNTNYLNKFNDKYLNLINKNTDKVSHNNNNKEEIIYFLSDKFILSDEIKENYGIFNNSNKNSNYLRINWINNQKDYGGFFYAYITKYIYDNLDLIKNKNKFKDILKEFKNKITSIKTYLDEEEKSKNYFNCKKYKIKVQYKDDLYNLDNVENGDIAFVSNLNSLFMYKEEEWNFIKNYKENKSLKEICLIDKHIKDIGIKDLLCVFENECFSRKFYRYKKKYENYNTIINRFEELLNILDSDDFKNKIYNNYTNAKHKINILKFKLNISNNSDVDIKNYNSKDLYRDVDILNKVFKLNNNFIKKYLIYKIIDIDGLTIDNYIYSKKYKKPMLCSHWYIIKKYENAINLNNKKIIASDLLSKYGDYTRDASSSNIYCKYCGDIIDIVNYDIIDGFDSYGHIKRIRDVMTNNEKNPKVLISKELNEFETIVLDNIDCSEKSFRELMINKGIPIENLKVSFDICNILKLLLEKISLKLSTKNFIEIIKKCTIEIICIISFKIFKTLQISQLLKLGKTDQIKKLEETTFFKDKYSEYYNFEKIGIITSILLIDILTATPEYKFGLPKTSCSLINWKDGLNYLTCIIKELGILNKEIIKRDGSKKKIIIKEIDILNKFSTIYNNLIKNKEYQDVFSLKEEYNNKIKIIKKKIEINKNFKIDFKKTNIPKKLSSNFLSNLFSRKEDMKDNFNNYYSRQLYLNIEILSIIQYIISNSKIDLPYYLPNGVLTNVTCCSSKIEKNNNYLNYFIKLNNNLKYLNDESLSNYQYDKYFVRTGTLSVMFPKVHKWLSIYQVGDILNEDIYKLLNKYYVNKGNFIGIKRIYVGDDKYDIVSGLSLHDIEKEDITKNEYENLLDNIFKLNLKDGNIYKFKIKEDLPIEKDYISLVNSLGEKITSILGETSDFKIKFKNILTNLGMNYQNKNIKSKIEIIKYNQWVYVNRINNLKNYINHFMRYLEMIKKKVRVANIPKYKFDDPEEQKKFFFNIKDEIEFVEEFYSYNDLFNNLNFSLSSNEINIINGIETKYCRDLTRIKTNSKLTFKLASEYLLSFLFNDLNNWLIKKDSITSNDKTFSSISINTIICKFIMKIFNKIDTNFNLLKEKKSYTSYKEAMQFQYENRFNLKYQKMSSSKKEFKKELYSVNTDEQLIEKEEDIRKSQIDNKVIDQEQTEYAKEMIQTQEGREATSQEIEDFKENLEDEIDIDKEIQEEFDSTQVRSINMITDIGDDYGEETQDIDPAGSLDNETSFLDEMQQFQEGLQDGPAPYGQTSGQVDGPTNLELIPEEKLKSWGWN